MDTATMIPLMGRSKREWRTPPDFYAALDREFGFNLDPAASDDNHLCARYFTAASDGLAQPWYGWVFLNPPYGDNMQWLAKARHEVDAGHAKLVCALIPARTDTRYWHDYAMTATEIRFVRGRLCFLGPDGQPIRDAAGRAVGAPFPSALVVLDGGTQHTDCRPRVRGWPDVREA